MLEKIMDFFKLAYRQKAAVYRLRDVFRGKYWGMKCTAVLLVIAEALGCILLDTPMSVMGGDLNLDGYKLVFEDEFDGDTLNTDVWNYRATGARRGGFNDPSQIEVSNGSLKLTAEYLEKEDETKSGWYAGMINLKEYYTRGYFEIRCICNKDKGFWSAFWLQSPNAYNHDKSMGGVGGAEIDIFEAMAANDKFPYDPNVVTHTIHCNGVDDVVDEIDSCCLGDFKVGRDIYNEYNTYGLEWTEDEYIFYINGKESARSSFGKGTSTTPQEVIVSLEIPEDIPFEPGYTSQMIVDYVRIYQK